MVLVVIDYNGDVVVWRPQTERRREWEDKTAQEKMLQRETNTLWCPYSWRSACVAVE